MEQVRSKIVDTSISFYFSFERVSERKLQQKGCRSFWVIWEFFQSKLPKHLTKQLNLSMDHCRSRRPQSEADLPHIHVRDLS